MTLNDRMFPALSFLVFVHDPVVAEDIASTLEESHPGARIVLPANEAAALAALDEHPQITLAVMSMSPEAAQEIHRSHGVALSPGDEIREGWRSRVLPDDVTPRLVPIEQ